MTSLVTVSDDRGVRLITFNRPVKKNALTQEMYATVIAALESGDANPAVRAYVITGAGTFFTSGNDLADFTTSPNGSPSAAARFPTVLSQTNKPLLAAVNGPAIGVGTTMLFQCDLVYASDTATFKTPFVDLALIPEGASSILMPAALGKIKAKELLMLGETWTAAQAFAAGMIGQVFAAESVLAETLHRAHRIAAKAPAAVRAAKELIDRDKPDVLKTITAANAAFAARLTSPEFAEAMGAAMGKRPSDFSRFE